MRSTVPVIQRAAGVAFPMPELAPVTIATNLDTFMFFSLQC
jgi:hypothetical protein